MIKKPNVLIGGGTGLVGQRLSELLRASGYGVHILTRSPKGRKNHFVWDIKSKTLDINALNGVSHIINLAGKGLADGPWTKSSKQQILDSRINSTNLLIEKSSRHKVQLKSFVSASAVGIYGDSGDKWLYENDRGNPQDFLVNTCLQWENALNHDALADTRKVRVRIGLVMSKMGGVLPKLLMPFKFGFGTYFGDGKQYYPWIHIDDLCHIFIKCIEDDSLEGAYNAVAPNPHSNVDLVRGIGECLNSSNILRVPAFLLKFVLGEMATMLLNSNRVSADKILKSGFEFKYPILKPALQDLLK